MSPKSATSINTRFEQVKLPAYRETVFSLRSRNVSISDILIRENSHRKFYKSQERQNEGEGSKA